jgi:hypothetical protein
MSASTIPAATSQLERLRKLEIVPNLKVRVLRVNQLKTAADTPVYALSVQPTTVKSMGSTKLMAILVMRTLNRMVIDKIIEVGTTMVLSDYAHDPKSSADSVSLKVKKLQVELQARVKKEEDEEAASSADEEEAEEEAEATPLKVKKEVKVEAPVKKSPEKRSKVVKTEPVGSSGDGFGEEGPDVAPSASVKKETKPAKKRIAGLSESEDDSDHEESSAAPAPTTETWKYLHQLDPHTNRWKSLVRVTYCSNIGKMKYADPDRSGELELRTINVIDGNGDQMGITLFGDQGKDRAWGGLFKPGVLMVLRNLTVKKAKEGKENSKLYVYDMTINSKKEGTKQFVQLVGEDELADEDVKKPALFNITPLGELHDKEDKAMVTVTGVVLEISDCIKDTSKAGKKYAKRMITIRDSSNTDTELCIMTMGYDVPRAQEFHQPKEFGLPDRKTFDWKDVCPSGELDYSKLPVVLIHNTSISRFGGNLTLDWKAAWMTNRPTAMWIGADGHRLPSTASTTGDGDGSSSDSSSDDDDDAMSDSGTSAKKPKIPPMTATNPVALQLREWLQSQHGQPSTAKALSVKRAAKPADWYTAPRFLLADVKSMQPSDEIFGTIKVFVEKVVIKESPREVCQILCSEKPTGNRSGLPCPKELRENEDGTLSCPTHGVQAAGSERVVSRLDVVLMDESGAGTYRVYDKISEALLLGTTATELHRLSLDEKLDEIVQCTSRALRREWLMLCKLSMSTYSAQPKAQLKIVDIQPVDAMKEIAFLDAKLQETVAPLLSNSDAARAVADANAMFSSDWVS